jgi:glycosyltransferase involved in cell wall biosynthesis
MSLPPGKKPRIGILHYSAPPVIGGVEAVILAHSRQFLRAGYFVRLIAGRGAADGLPAGAQLALLPEMDSQQAKIVQMSKVLEAGQVPDGFDPMVKKLQAALQPLLVDLDYLIVHNVFTKHFNLPLTAALHRLIGLQSSPRMIAWCHDLTWTSPHSRRKVHPGYPWDLLRTYRQEVTYVVISQSRRDELAGLFACDPDTIHLIYNGVNPQQLLGISQEGMALIERLGMLEAGLAILMPVRITQAKNVEYALRVAASLKAQHRHPLLVQTGPPDPHDPQNMEYFHSLKTLRRELGVEDAMRFVYESGPQADQPYRIDEDVVGDLYRLSDAVFMPSHREGFGMPVLEAGLAGLPVICTRFPAAQEIGSQLIVPFSSDQPPEATARLIIDTVDSNPLSHMRRLVRQNYTWRAIFRREIEPLLG